MRVWASSVVVLKVCGPIIDSGSAKWLLASYLPYSHVPFHKESIFPADKTAEDDEGRTFFSLRRPFMHMASYNIINASLFAPPLEQVAVARARAHSLALSE
jgi:hypothetical protein